MQGNLKKAVITGGSIIFASIVVFFVAFAWLSGDMEVQADGIQSARKSSAQDTYSLESFAALKRDATLAGQYAVRLDALVPSRDGVLSFPRWIETTSRTYKVNAQASFKSSPAAGKQGTIGSVDFALDAIGPYDGLKEFLGVVEGKAPRFLIVFDSISVSKEADAYHAAVKGRVFFRQ